MPKKTLLEEVGDRLGIPETIKSDNILRWNGPKLYIVDEVYRGVTKVRSQERDVSKGVANFLRKR
jgi:hypothetical protein